MHHTSYDLERPVDSPNLRNSISRTLPIASLDGGLIFEREAQFFGGERECAATWRTLYTILA